MDPDYDLVRYRPVRLITEIILIPISAVSQFLRGNCPGYQSSAPILKKAFPHCLVHVPDNKESMGIMFFYDILNIDQIFIGADTKENPLVISGIHSPAIETGDPAVQGRHNLFSDLVIRVRDDGSHLCAFSLIQDEIYTTYYEDYEVFCRNAVNDVENAKQTREYGLDMMNHPNWFDASYISWLSYDSLNVELPDGFLHFAPIVNWGKYREENGFMIITEDQLLILCKDNAGEIPRPDP